MANTLYVNGVIAVKEKTLLGEKLLRFCEMPAGDVLRALRESGFGGGREGNAEVLLAEEERALDAFVRDCAPSPRERAYLLAPRDFHNAKAIVKAIKLGTSAEKMLAPAGEIPVEALEKAAAEGEFETLGTLGRAMKTALADETAGGAETGAIFERALFAYLKKTCARPLLKKLLAGKADRTNILTAMRASSAEEAEKQYVTGGKLRPETLSALFDEEERAAHVLDGTPYAAFSALCFAAREKKHPYSEAERELGSFEAEFFRARKYELEGKEPFLYYVFRRRAEIGNVRTVLVCLNAGLDEKEIKRRLRAV